MNKTESAHLEHSLEAGLEVKYLIMLLCIKGIRQQHRTTAFTAMIPGKQCFQKLMTMMKCEIILKQHSDVDAGY